MRAASICAATLALLTSVAVGQDAPLFAMPEDAVPARRARFDHARVVDCGAHGVWTPPAGWATARIASSDVVAIAPDGRALIARASTRTRATRVRSAEAFLAATTALVARFAEGPPVLGEVVEHARSRWHVDRSVEGSASVRGAPVVVHAESRGERHLWASLAAGTNHDAELAAARESWAGLVSHACECEYDCDRRTERAD